MKYFILGYMGAGKSHTGRLLAQKLNIPFLDTDEQIEIQEGKSVSTIFEEIGETGFRKLERDYLESLEAVEQAVVATGGGMPCFNDNMALIKTLGKSIYLRTHPKLLANRLSKEKETRPLIANLSLDDLEAFIIEKILERQHFYEQATLVYFQEEEGQDVVSELVVRLPIII